MVVTPPEEQAPPPGTTARRPCGASDEMITQASLRAYGRPERATANKPDEATSEELPPISVRPQASDEKALSEAAPEPPPAAPLTRVVNNKRITLNFEVTDVGPSGVSGVEVWFIQDGKGWNKVDAPANAKSYVLGVDKEGTYGFTLLARSGNGLSHPAPRPGDQPQMWVVVDVTPPVVELMEAKLNGKPSALTVGIRWKATDKNLGRNSIRLSYAEKEAGPWKTIASNLPNSGRHDWKVPPGAPARVLLRVEATDLAGNVGRAQTPESLLLDTARPSVSILAVEPNTR
jgi:hypothetical protein